MADLNALIAQGAQFRQPESPLNMMAQLQQLQQSQSANQLNQMNIAEKQRTIEEQGALRGLYSRSAGQMETPAFLQQLAATSPSAYQAHLKFLDEQKKAAADIKYTGAKTGEAIAKTGETEFDVARKKKEFVKDSLSDMSFNPSDANIIAFAEDAVLHKYLTPEAAQAKVDELLGMPIPDRKVYLATQGLSSKDTAGLFESKPVEKSDGQNKWMEEGNPRLPNYGKRMVGPKDIKMQATPGERLTAGTAGARLAFEQTKFNWEKANPGFDLIQQDDGSYLAVNKKNPRDVTPLMMAAPGGAAAPAAGAPGARGAINVGDGGRPAMVPVTGKAVALNESQGAATAFGMRMKAANDILEDLSKEGTVKGAVIERTPFIGGVLGQALPSFAGGTSETQQQFNQAKSNFITAILRKESGAVIGDDEFEREDKKYFPQINDGPKVIKQKKEARELAIKAMAIQAGPGAKNIGATAKSKSGNVVTDPRFPGFSIGKP